MTGIPVGNSYLWQGKEEEELMKKGEQREKKNTILARKTGLWHRKSREEELFKMGVNQKDLTTVEKSYGGSIFTVIRKKYDSSLKN